MNTQKEEFTLDLISSADQNRHPNNVISDFTTTLNESINLHGKWGVALQSISYPNTFVNLDDREIEQEDVAQYMEGCKLHLYSSSTQISNNPDKLCDMCWKGDEVEVRLSLPLSKESIAKDLNNAITIACVPRHIKYFRKPTYRLSLVINDRGKRTANLYERQRKYTLHIGRYMYLLKNEREMRKLILQWSNNVATLVGRQSFISFSERNSLILAPEPVLTSDEQVKLTVINSDPVENNVFVLEHFLGFSGRDRVFKIKKIDGKIYTTVTLTATGAIPSVRTFLPSRNHFRQSVDEETCPMCADSTPGNVSIEVTKGSRKFTAVKKIVLTGLTALFKAEDLADFLFDPTTQEVIKVHYDKIQNKYNLQLTPEWKDGLCNIQIVTVFSSFLPALLGARYEDVTYKGDTFPHPTTHLSFLFVDSLVFDEESDQSLVIMNRAKVSKYIEFGVFNNTDGKDILYANAHEPETSYNDGINGIQVFFKDNFSKVVCFTKTHVHVHSKRKPTGFEMEEKRCMKWSEGIPVLEDRGWLQTLPRYISGIALHGVSWWENFIPVQETYINQHSLDLKKYENVMYLHTGILTPDAAYVMITHCEKKNLQCPGCYNTPDLLIEGIYRTFSHIPVRLNGNVDYTLALEDILDIKFFEAANKFHFTFKSVPEESTSITKIIDVLELSFSPKLSALLGFNDGADGYHLKLQRELSTSRNLFPQIIFPNDGLKVVASTKEIIPSSGDSTTTVDLRSGMVNLYIYTNIVHNTFLGNQLLSFLSVIPISGRVGEYKYHPLFIPVYKPCNTSKVEDITIRVLDYKGDRARFRHGSGPVHILLHFKRFT